MSKIKQVVWVSNQSNLKVHGGRYNVDTDADAGYDDAEF